MDHYGDDHVKNCRCIYINYLQLFLVYKTQITYPDIYYSMKIYYKLIIYVCFVFFTERTAKKIT
jgi:hypothetical protein